MAPISEPEEPKEKRGVLEEATVFNNIALLGDLLGNIISKFNFSSTGIPDYSAESNLIVPLEK
jgi:hypothetical protein